MDKKIEAEMIALLPRLRRFALTLTGSRADADDLLQTTCVRAIENIDSWKAGTRLDSWLYRLAQNLHRNGLRHDRVRADHRASEEDIVSDAALDDTPLHALTLQEVEAAINRLPAEQRIVLLLVAVEGYGYQEAGALLDLSAGTVASRLSRARAALTDHFADVERSRASG